MQLHCVEDRMAETFNEMPLRRRRRSLSHCESSYGPLPPDAPSLVDALLTSAADLYDRLWRLAFPRPFTPSSQVFHWPERSAKMAEIWTDESGTWRYSDLDVCYDDCEATASTECSSDGWFSDIDGDDTPSEEAHDLEEDDTLETRAARVLSVASYCPDDAVLVVEQYLCKCGKCKQYDVIAQDVARAVTWREPDEVARVTRILQAFSTYNEAIGYHPGMIETADECLSTWSGDEDQAFTSFVVLQDVVPFLCANAV